MAGMGSWIEAEDARITAMLAVDRMLRSAASLAGMRRESPDTERRLRQARASLVDAGPIWIAPEMAPLILAAMAGFAPEPWHVADLVTRSGFVLMPDGSLPGERNFEWDPADPHPRAHEVPRDARDPSIAIAFQWAVQGHRITIHAWSVSPRMTILMESADIAEGERIDGVFATQVQCICRLMAERVTVARGEPTPKPARRRAERASLAPSATIRVVELRRPDGASSGAEHGAVEWQTRWIVGGHWRRHWWPKLREHRQTWIAPYVKGPADKPLVLPAHTVYAFDR